MTPKLEILEGEIVNDIPTAADLLDLLHSLEPAAPRPKREPPDRDLIRDVESITRPLVRPLYLRPIGGNMSERKAKIVYRDNPATVALALLVGFAAGGLAVGLSVLLFGALR